MTADELLRSLGRAPLHAAYLFLGPETWTRSRCRKALIEAALGPEDWETGLTRHDLSETDLATVLDDARSMSLFASKRVIWVTSAEAALPRRASAETEDEGGNKESGSLLASYFQQSSEGVVLVFDCSRYDFEGDDKAKLQRVQKFFSAIPGKVEFPEFSTAEMRKLAQELVRERGVKIGSNEIDLLVESIGNSAIGLVNEIDKLSLYAGKDRAITAEDIARLVPNAKASTIFALVNALGKRNRIASLESLDLLIQEGEYLPLALSFLNTQFRLALVAKEQKLTSANQVQAYFTKQGTNMWRSRAEQVAQTAAAFPPAKLGVALSKLYEADRAMRDTRPDDRTVMEKLVLDLTNA